MTGTQAAQSEERRFHVDPLPPFATAEGVIMDALVALTPSSRQPVTETSRRRNVDAAGQWVEWRPDVTPYMLEPMDTTTSRRFQSLIFCGPARTGKSEGLVLGPIAHAALADPKVIGVFSPTKGAAQEWSEGALSPMIQNSPELRAKLATGKGADNIFTKRFRGGTRITADWPVLDKLAQRSLGLAIATDMDAFPADIGGDGDVFPLMVKRVTAAGSRGMAIGESSPRKPVLDEGWTPKTPHEAPPCGGVLGHYNAGSRGRFYWACPDCAHVFEPRKERLHYPDEGSPAERGAAAVMVCPDCGSVIPPRMKAELNRKAAAREDGAGWWHEEADGSRVRLEDLTRPCATASYWIGGPVAAFASWAQIVTRLLEAEAAFAATGDEGQLKAVVNTDLGLPYLPRGLGDEAQLSETALRDGASDHAWQVVPEGAAFLTAAVDVQRGRFVCQVVAWFPDLSRVLVDRFDIHAPPLGAPRAGSRQIDPARYAEDWAALEAIPARAYPVAGSDHGLQPVAVIIDAGGAEGVTPNAYGFWRRMRTEMPRRFHLVRGRGGDLARRVHVSRPETAHKGKAHAARDVVLIWAATDRLKNEIAASLTRPAGGARKLWLPRLAPSEVFAEAASERKTPKGWQKKPGQVRNEALDLFVYDLALALALEVEALNPEKPPAWAKPGLENQFAVAMQEAAPATPETDTLASLPAPKPAPRMKVRRGKSMRW